MKKTFVVKLAVAALLALGSISQAQEEATAIPAVDAPAPEAVAVVDGQQSVSDNVVVEGEVAPVAPIQESVIYDSNVSVGSDCLGCSQASGCVGCGQSNPVFSAPMVSAPMVSAPVFSAPLGSRFNGLGLRNQGTCSSCNSCSSCGVPSGQFAQVQFAQPQFVEAPVSSACGQGCSQCSQGCGQIGQVAFNQEIYQAPTTLVSSPTSVVTGPIYNPAPQPAVQVLSPGCGSCGSAAVTTCGAASTVACDTCQPSRLRLFRGRLLRNR